MKKNHVVLMMVVSCVMALAACKPTTYLGSYGQINQTQVVLSEGNFKVLGSFKGIATQKKLKVSVKNQEGLVSQAKSALLESAKAAGVELTGSRTLINVCVDVVQNENKVTATMSAEVIEFTR